MLYWWKAWRTDAGRVARKMGYVREAIGIEYRYRRVGQHWQEHLANCHRIIRQAALHCPNRGRAVVIGAGLLHDVPLAELSTLFREVTLVDICFPPRTRKQVQAFENVHLLRADVTQTVEELYSLPDPQKAWENRPLDRFAGESIDLVVSLNVLSQLPCMPMDFLHKWGYDREWSIHYARRVIEDHLHWVRRLGKVQVLITDIELQKWNPFDQLKERKDLLFGILIPASDKVENWLWRLAPRPEVDPNYSLYRKVQANVWYSPEVRVDEETIPHQPHPEWRMG